MSSMPALPRPGWRAARLGLAFALVLAARSGRAAAQISPVGGGPQVTAQAHGQFTKVAQGAQQTVAVVMTHGEGFHTWPNPAQLVIPDWLGADFPAITTDLSQGVASEGVSAALPKILWPAAQEVQVDFLMTGDTEPLMSFKDRATILVPVDVAPDAPLGPASVELKLVYQSCDATTCYAPEEPTFTIDFEVVAAGTDFQAAVNPQFPPLGTDVAVDPVAPPCLRFAFFGKGFCLDTGGGVGLAALLLLAALGGLLLNFTPCVLPVLPIKIMGMSRAAGEPRRLAILGLVMSLGVVAFWLAIGAAIAFVSGFTAISSLFQTNWFSLGVGLFVVVMALGMLGLFDIVLPQSVYRYRPTQETAPGAFGFGVMTAVLSTPCTAPFMGTAAAWAARQAAPVTLTTFAAIGAGMALPYLALSLRPSWLSRVPRTGPASEVLKQVMGLAMLAVASFFIGIPLAGYLRQAPAPASRAYWWVVAAFVVAACAWLAWRTFQLTRSPGRRAFFGGAALLGAGAILALTPGLTSHGPIDWVYYRPDQLAQVEAEGKVAVVDFTAEWCLNCKTLERTVLHRPEIVALLGREDVVPVKVDLTGDNREGRDLLGDLGSVGIPLLAVMGPKAGYRATSETFDTYTVGVIQAAVERAAGAPAP